VNATIDHIPHLEIAARMAAELSANAGHDLVGINGFGPHLYRDSVVDLSALIVGVREEIRKRRPHRPQSRL
jgi:multiple sugar transport system substrate-binding protein